MIKHINKTIIVTNTSKDYICQSYSRYDKNNNYNFCRDFRSFEVFQVRFLRFSS